MEISVVIPVYKGEKSLMRLFEKICYELTGRYSYEVLFVHDKGSERSKEVIKRIVIHRPDVARGYFLPVNMGQHKAVLEGLKKARGEYIITMDEDLQHDPAYIIPLVEKQKEGGFDVVYAKFIKMEQPYIRLWMSGFLRVILRKTVPGLYPYYSPFRLIKRDMAEKILPLYYSYTFIDGSLGKVTDNFGYIDAIHHGRPDGESSYSYFKLFKHALLIMWNYSLFSKWRKSISKTTSTHLHFFKVVKKEKATADKVNSEFYSVSFCDNYFVTQNSQRALELLRENHSVLDRSANDE